ncbi:MAG: hypothetical protein EOM26_12960, partial [Alphaproteobacteria bacterium]|nr:hypothetical protein [Alphaproteobacteria bacterium]
MKRRISSLPFCTWPHRLRSVVRAALAAGLFTLASAPAQADINTVAPGPVAKTISAFELSASIPVTWTVTRTETVSRTVKTVSSANAEVVANGAVIGTIGGALQQSSGALVPGFSENLSFSETLVLPAHLIQRIAEAPAGSTVIRRTFTENTSASGEIALRMTLGNTGPLAVNRIGLAFENDSRTEVLRQGEAIRAVADVTYRGNGTLRGEWRLVDPTAALGSGTGRILEVVRLPLVSSGEGRTRIVSPALPTDRSGLHLLSFSVTGTTAGFEIPVIRYFVLEPRADRLPDAPGMVALAPADNASLSLDTVFTWQPVPGAAAYQVSLFDPGGTTPLAG